MSINVHVCVCTCVLVHVSHVCIHMEWNLCMREYYIYGLCVCASCIIHLDTQALTHTRKSIKHVYADLFLFVYKSPCMHIYTQGYRTYLFVYVLFIILHSYIHKYKGTYTVVHVWTFYLAVLKTCRYNNILTAISVHLNM